MFLSEVPKHWQLAACSDTLFCLLCRHSMDQLLPDGKSVTCLVGGGLFALDDFNRKGLHQSKEPASCTSQLSAWNVPSSSVAPASIDEIVLKKIKFGEDNVQRYKPRYNPFDPRLPNQRVLTQNIGQLTLNPAKHAPNSCCFAFMICQNLPWIQLILSQLLSVKSQAYLLLFKALVLN